MSAYECRCDRRAIFLGPCTCGAGAAERSDRDARERVRLSEDERVGFDRVRELSRFLIPEPTPPVTFRDLCPKCLHPAHVPAMDVMGQCPRGDCQCAG